MKKILIFLLCLILIPSAIASTFDDWVNDMETFKVGDHYFYVQYIESNQNLIFKMDNIGGIMLLGECETRENIGYCFEEVNYPQIRVKIYSLEPDITIERAFSNAKPYLNEQITVTVILKNEGDNRAESIRYTDAYPPGLNVFSDKNTKVWEGSINVGEEETFTYAIKAEDIISFDSTAAVSYKFGGKENTKKSSTETIEVQKSFTINHDISKKAADKNEIIDYNLTIANTDQSSKLTIEKLEITLPPKVDLVNSPAELKSQDNKLTFTGALEKKQSKTFVIKVKSSQVGKFTISAQTDIKIGDRAFKEELKQEFSVGLSYILPIINLTDNIKSNSPYPIYIAVKNYGTEEIKNVNIKLESNLLDNIEEKQNIAAGSTYDLLKKTLISPYLEEDKKYNLKISGSYISSSGKTYTFEKSAQLTVKAAPKIIQIIRELNKEEFYPGDEIKVAIKVKNQRDQIINEIDVSDIFPKEIRSSLLGDVTGYLEELKPNEEKNLYSYSLVIPENYSDDGIEFKTTLNAKIDGELTILKRTDNVKILKGEKPESLEEEQEVTAEEKEAETKKEEINETEEKEVKEESSKQNFFKKIINWIKNLFKRDKS